MFFKNSKKKVNPDRKRDAAIILSTLNVQHVQLCQSVHQYRDAGLSAEAIEATEQLRDETAATIAKIEKNQIFQCEGSE